MAKPAVTVHADTAAWRRLREAVTGASARVRVGVLRDSAHTAEDGAGKSISMLELAAIHEFGSPAAGIPERSFIRSTMVTKREELNQAIESIVGKSVGALLRRPGAGREEIKHETLRALGLVGQKAVALIRQTIRQRATTGPGPQELRPATIARKGSTLPLVDTGQLINSITYEVVEGAGTEGEGGE